MCVCDIQNFFLIPCRDASATERVGEGGDPYIGFRCECECWGGGGAYQSSRHTT